MKFRKASKGLAGIAVLLVTGLCASLQAAAGEPAAAPPPAAAQPDEAASAAALAKASLNPVAALISVPMKLDWDTGLGETNANRNLWVVQPVIPISLNDKWNLISRSVTPVWIDVGPTVEGGSSTTGMGDILQSFFFSPKAPTASGWIWGAGPAINIPTSSEASLGTNTWGLGPTFVVLKQEHGWTYGMLANQVWSVAGETDGQNYSSMFLQPFLSFTTKTYTTFGINSESTYDWEGDEWTVPINLTITQMLKLGKQPLTLLFGYRNYLDAPAGGPDWGIRFQVTLLYPK